MKLIRWNVFILGFFFLLSNLALAVSLGDPIRASDVMNIRSSINAKRQRCGLSAANWTDDPLIAGTPIKAVHINELRASLNGLTVVTAISTDPGVIKSGNAIKAAYINELNATIATLSCAAACGPATGLAASKTAPATGLCSSGVASAPTTIVGTLSPWTWTCLDPSGATNVNCSLAKNPTYNTSVLSGTGQSPCGWFPSISSGSSWGCTCMTGQPTTSTTCTANSWMTHGNNYSSCVYTCNLKPTN